MPSKLRVGWITSEYPRRPSPIGVWLRSGAMLTMRYRNVALYLNRMGFHNSFYRANQSYDAVVIIKSFHQEILEAAYQLKQQKTFLVYDANVNYYYIWGDYTDPRTHPTREAQHAATTLTQLADHVIADSEYIRDVVMDFNPQVTWVPDNVLPVMFSPTKHRDTTGTLRLIWSGMAFKSNELQVLKPVFAQVPNLELWLVSNARPPIIDVLQDVISMRWFRYSDWRYSRLLKQADAIISPRYLNNGYNLGHTEYKITLGMARGLPAIVSPQPSYVTAVQRHNGGILCYTEQDWIDALTLLRDDAQYRLAMGQRAAGTVKQYYSTPVVAQQMAAILNQGR